MSKEPRLSLEILDPKDLELGIALLGLDDVDAMAHVQSVKSFSLDES